MKRAFFLDRDGVLIEEVGYLADPGGVKLLAGAAEAIKLIHASGFLAVVVSNQSGVARGYYGLSEVEAVSRRMCDLLKEAGPDAAPDAIYICPHHEKYGYACGCRKPQPGMLLAAAHDYSIDLGNSLMIGDRCSDLQAGEAAGCRESFLVTSGYGENSREEAAASGHRIFPGILEAVKFGVSVR